MASYAGLLHLFGLITLSLVATSYSLSCYECTDAAVNTRGPEAKCDNFTNATLTNCSGNVTECLKYVTEIGNITTETHSCGVESVEDSCTKLEEASDDTKTITCYSCDENGCNSASAVTNTLLLSLSALVFAKFY